MQFSICVIFLLECAMIWVIDAKSVTYDGIGTFTDNDFYDKNFRTNVKLPYSPEKIDPKFLLYTRTNRNRHQELIWNNDTSIRNSDFKGWKSTKMIIHGYVQSLTYSINYLKDQLLEIGDFNVILVDWSNGSYCRYDQAVANTRLVGRMVAIQINKICRIKDSSPGKFHLIGYSLGAHIFGEAGKFLKKTLSQITGLDPAGPSFEGMPPEARLWHTDAKFVDVIHTDCNKFDQKSESFMKKIKSLIGLAKFGMYETCGHIDFYPNNCKQPGCEPSLVLQDIFKNVLNIFGNKFKKIMLLLNCNHRRSLQYYTETLGLEFEKSRGRAFQCEDYQKFLDGKCLDCGPNEERCALIGLRSLDWANSVRNRGNGGKRFFLQTNSEKPFFTYQYALILEFVSFPRFEMNATIKLNPRFRDGRSIELEFNKDAMNFKSGQSYSKVVVSSERLDGLSMVRFRMKPIQNTGNNNYGRAPIYCIQLKPLSLKTSYENKIKAIKLCKKEKVENIGK